MIIDIIKPIGECIGVKRTIDLIDSLAETDKKIYIVGSLVHNELIINKYSDPNKYQFIKINENTKEILSSLDNNSIVLFSAHGHKKEYERILTLKGINFYDSTCEIIKKYHSLIDYYKGTKDIYFYGDINHEESKAVEDVAYIIDNKTINKITDNSLVLFQTTSSEKDFKYVLQKVPNSVSLYDSRCKTVEYRITELLSYKGEIDKILCLGSTLSSNTELIYKACLTKCKNSYKINSIEELSNINFSNNDRVLLISGCSCLTITVNQIIDYLKERY